MTTDNPETALPDTRLGVSLLLIERDRVLFGRKAAAAAEAPRLWGLPGGELAFLETTSEAIARVAAARTGLRVEPAGIVALCEIIHPPLTHRIVLVFQATVLSSALVPEEDDIELQWFDRAALERAAADAQISESEIEVLRVAGRLARPAT